MYSVIDLGDLGGNESLATDVNAGGDCSALARLPSVALQACVFSGGALTQLPTLGGFNSFAYGINASKQVVGACELPSGQHAVLWNPGGPATDIQPFGSNWGEANAISDAGHVTGSATHPASSTRAFLWKAGTVAQDLGTLGGPVSFGYDVNVLGHVVGQSYVDATRIHAFHWSPGGGMIGIAPAGSTWSRAEGINRTDTVVGEYFLPPSTRRTFLWKPGTGPVDLVTTPGVHGLDVNDQDEVVGEMANPGTTTQHAFHFAGGVLTDLNDAISPLSGWTLITATAINNMGQIVGDGLLNGERRGFLLIPVPVPVPPEPHPWDPMEVWHRVRRMQMVSSILSGVVDDSGGIVWPFDRPPVPVPPWTGLWQRLSQGDRDALLGEAIGILATHVGNDRARVRVLESVAELRRRAEPSTERAPSMARV